MRFALLTYGTRGDIQPFLGLAIRLQAGGHSVRLAAPKQFEALAVEYNLPIVLLEGDPSQFSRDLVDKAGANPWRIIQVGRHFVTPLASQVITGIRTACEGADVIIHTFLMTTGGHAIAQEMNIPDIAVQLFPVFASTDEFPSPAFPELPLGRLYNRLTHEITTQTFWHGGCLIYNSVKRTNPAFPRKITWPFQPSSRPMTPRLYAFSPTVIPRPHDWGRDIFITGYWQMDSPVPWQPPQEAVNFLDYGSPPICISFGSVVSRDANHIYHTVLEALSKTGQRGLILTGWGGWRPDHLPKGVCVLEGSAP